MKNHFPFTDYDFYAYLVSGGLFLAVSDYALNNSTFLGRTDWAFTQIVLVVALAYVVGHVIAMLAQGLLENIVLSKLLANPMEIQLRLKKPNKLETLIGGLVGRYYAPLPALTCNSIKVAAANELGTNPSEITDCEDVFQVGFRRTFEKDIVRVRLDDFRNQYGFCRNIVLVAALATILLVWKGWIENDAIDYWAALATMLLSAAMFIRYVKFLSSFQAEVIRSVR